MNKSKLSKILLLVALTLALVCTLSIVAFAEDSTDGNTSTSNDNMVYETELGTFIVSDKYADVNAYPWVSFNVDTGACLYGSALFAQNNNSILSHGNSGYSQNMLVILRRDLTVTESSQWHNAVWNAGRDFVIDLQGHTLTLAYGMSPLFSAEAKTSGLVKYTFRNGNIVQKTTKPMVSAAPRTDKSGLVFELNFTRINYSIDQSIASSSFALFCTPNITPGNNVKVNFNFTDSNLDFSNAGSGVTLFRLGSPQNNIETNVTFKGGNIKGNPDNLTYRYNVEYLPIRFEKNAAGNYPTVTVSSDSAVPTRIFTASEGLLSFNDTDKVVGADGYTTYTPSVVTSDRATPYGWLPEADGLVTVFDASTQKVIYKGDVFSSSDTNSALGSTVGKGGQYVIYLRKDIPASATKATAYDISNATNGILIDMNNHSITLNGRALIRSQVKSSGAVQNFIFRNGTIVNNGQKIIQVGAVLTSSGVKRENANISFTFDNVDFNITSGSLITDDVERDYNNTFNITFNECDFHVAKGYSQTLFSLGNFSTTKTNVTVKGGSFTFGDTTIPSIYSLNGKSNVGVKFLPGADGQYPAIKTATASAESTFTVVGSDRTIAYAKPTTEGEVSTYLVYEKTVYGYIDFAHFDRTAYPMAVFVVNKPFDTWYPTKYGDESAGTIVTEIYNQNGSYNKVDCVLLVRNNTTFNGSVYHCSPRNNFTIDLGGNTVTMGCILFRFQTRTSGTANITVKNGTINANDRSIITHGFQNSKTTYVTFENVTFTNVHRLMGEEAGSQNQTASLVFNVAFNNCIINQKSNANLNLFNFTSETWWPTANIQINGGTINFTNGKYMLATNTNPELIKISFGAYNGEYTDFIVKNTVDWSAFVEPDANGFPLQMVKSADNGTNETYTLTPLSLISTYLNLTHDINVVYRVFLPAGYTNPVATFTVGEDEVTVTEYTVDENGLYCFKLTAIAPHKMGDFVNVSVSATYNDKPNTITNDKVSIKSYADALRAQYASDTDMLALLDALLVYGATAQTYMNYKLDALVAEVGELAAVPEFAITLAGENSAVASIAACGLMLDGAFDLRVGITAQSLEGLTLEIAKGDKTTVVELTEDMKNGDYIVVYYDGLLITELDTEVTFTLKQNGVAVGKTLTFSANAYLYRMQNSENTALASLTKALYAYGTAAKAYNA